MLKYLSRYTHHAAISNERIVAISGREVVLSVRADDRGRKRRIRPEAVVWLACGCGGCNPWQPRANATPLGQFNTPPGIPPLNVRANAP